MKPALKFQSALYLYILITIGLTLIVPPAYALEAVLIFLFLIVFSGTIFYSLLIAASRRDYPFKVEAHKGNPFFEPLVYVLIPAHNEEKVIEITARTVLNQDYHNFKLFLINDNSTDSTKEIMERIASENPKRVVVIDVPPERGRSKPRALNYTLELIEQSRDHPDYVFILDADYLLPSNALRTLVGIMENAPEYVLGVQGNVRPRNWDRNFVTKFITLERLVGFNVAIEGDMKLNENGKYGGTVALLRFSHLLRLGMFREDSVTEDTDLWARAMISGYRFWYYHGVIGWEEAVETLKDYIKQRSRWAQGHFQVMLDYYWNVLRSCSGITEGFIEHFYLISYLVPVFWFLSVVLNGYIILSGNVPLMLAKPGLFLAVSITAFLVFWASVAYSNWVEMKRHNYHVPWSFVAAYPCTSWFSSLRGLCTP
ncbi:glycosyltransferase, family 2 [Thermococcus kodakarensis KOD1]|uniref:Glycosyltransferase, family 2 n=1 Tax=Thermococcus kodakarensis (strain ATCC BAA-918 / JCM 12380 / KOD1) TaxID=69014 RepID=Q5JIN0_THEKO|nr:glycosyltransferase family 2 protein [Thermococcus kodakarensis]WCN27503.1 glycosyltransferase family 2 protein [Thermococcus kodakarensis]WCN29793.1 glycosyltransferase family 2 protein [Thermococcus kodakarensis]BAD85743.1 glycosyltransferase, family 2 [Thermococcus kodakarensis KOD1]